MEVYSKYNISYQLSRKPVTKTFDGSIYDVVSDPGLQVKILDKGYCTDEMERTVEDSIYGAGTIVPAPIETIYYRNRFAGYVMPRQVLPEPEPELDAVPVTAPVPSPKTGDNVIPVLCLIAFGLLGSILIYFLIFPHLSSNINQTVATVNFGGIPMIAGGWILLIICSLKSGLTSWNLTVLGIFAFLLGAALVYGVISILTYLLLAFFNVYLPMLAPVILFIVFIVVIFKSIVGK